MWKTLSRHGCCKYEHMCGFYHLKGMNPASHDSALLQVVIGGINVDFIAKGKTKTLRVRFSQLKIAVLIYRWTNLHLVVSFSSGRPTQEVCSSHLEALVATLPVRFYTITSHVHYLTPGLHFTAGFFQDSLSRLEQRTLLISVTGADPSSDAVFKQCKHMVSQHQHREIILLKYANLPSFSLCVRTWVVWPG